MLPTYSTSQQPVVDRLQLGAFDKQFHKHKGPLDVLRGLVATEGPRGLLRGMGATMAREVPGNALYFVTYHGLRRRVDGVTGAAQWDGVGRSLYEAGAAIACGGTAGVVMWCVCAALYIGTWLVQGGGVSVGRCKNTDPNSKAWRRR